VKIRNPLKTNIISSKAFEEVEACVAVGMDFERWDDIRPEVTYPRELKVKVIAWYRLRAMIESHVGDTQIEYQKREIEKARKKR
jgi:hypothetical protein